MEKVNGSWIFYGLDNCEEKVDNIINELNLKELYFEIKLIIFEALSNAFIHGNKKDMSKPIFLECYSYNKVLKIHIKDCGSGVEELSAHDEIEGEDLLEEGGRGLFIIRNYTDEMYFEGNSIIMTKYV